MRLAAEEVNALKRILYVEDNTDTAEAVQVILTNAGYYVDLASCGKDAIGKAGNGFDIILLDIMLPDMSGWDIFYNLKGRVKNARFAFLSAIPISDEHLKELKSQGVEDYIPKPFTKQELIRRIETIAKK